MNSLKLAQKSRIDAVKMVHRAKAAHIGSALSIVDILAVLYSDILNIDTSNLQQEHRDRFILSKGHGCVAVYSILANLNVIDKELLKEYGKSSSILMNHISHKVPGVEFSTGSLGHGLPFGVGKALAAKISGKNWRTYVLLSDGEMQEGSNWEALMFSAHHKLNNLIAIIDYNNLQSLTTVEETQNIEPLKDKLISFGWRVHEVDGHNHNEIKVAFDLSAKEKNKPSIIICKTIKGKGVSYMENQVAWHYKHPNDEELQIAIKELENA